MSNSKYYDLPRSERAHVICHFLLHQFVCKATRRVAVFDFSRDVTPPNDLGLEFNVAGVIWYTVDRDGATGIIHQSYYLHCTLTKFGACAGINVAHLSVDGGDPPQGFGRGHRSSAVRTLRRMAAHDTNAFIAELIISQGRGHVHQAVERASQAVADGHAALRRALDLFGTCLQAPYPGDPGLWLIALEHTNPTGKRIRPHLLITPDLSTEPRHPHHKRLDTKTPLYLDTHNTNSLLTEQLPEAIQAIAKNYFDARL